MSVFLILIMIIAILFSVTALITGATILVCRLAYPCNHSYERVDTCNDKKMILVCRKCGKIKKLSK